MITCILIRHGIFLCEARWWHPCVGFAYLGWGEHNRLKWRYISKILSMLDIIIHWGIFSLFGKLRGHLLVYDWFCPAKAFLKWYACQIISGWDDKVQDTIHKQMMLDIIIRICTNDSALGLWCVNRHEFKILVNASLLATAVLREVDGSTVEDACWLRPVNNAHCINFMEFDAIVKSVNLELQWKVTVLHLVTDSSCVHCWVMDTLMGKAIIHTKAVRKMIILMAAMHPVPWYIRRTP